MSELLSLYFVLFLVGCVSTAQKTSQVINDATVITSAAPSLGAYTSAQLSYNSLQGSSISLDMNPSYYSKVVSKQELLDIADAHGWKFYEPWKYMGTKEGYHYLALYPSLGFRTIYRIAENDYKIENPFPLTSLTFKWRDISIVQHNNKSYKIILEQGIYYQPLQMRLENLMIRLPLQQQNDKDSLESLSVEDLNNFRILKNKTD